MALWHWSARDFCLPNKKSSFPLSQLLPLTARNADMSHRNKSAILQQCGHKQTQKMERTQGSEVSPLSPTSRSPLTEHLLCTWHLWGTRDSCPYLPLMICLFFFFFLQHVEVPRPGIEPVPKQQPEPLQWQYHILNLLSHTGTPSNDLSLTAVADHFSLRR